MVKYNSAKFKKSSGILKSFGLIALVAFTFYFIYNYLTTGSFDLRPSASGALEGDGGVASCGALLTQLDCDKYSGRGCSWVVGPKTTRTEVGPVTTFKPVTKTTQMNCEEDDCAKGNYGCKYTNTTKTVNQTQNQTIYGCDDGSSVSQTKCIQTGGSWIKMGTKTVTVPVTTTIKNCGGTYTRTYTVQEQVTDYVTKVVEIPGVGSCTGTLKPAPNTNGGSKPPGNAIPLPVPKPNTETCIDKKLRCSIDKKSIEICVNGNWEFSKECAPVSSDPREPGSCVVSAGLPVCKIVKCDTDKIYSKDCKLKDGSLGMRYGICTTVVNYNYISYGQCLPLKRQTCEVKSDGAGFRWRLNADSNWSKQIYGKPCVPFTIIGCVANNLSGQVLCRPVSDACSNIGYYKGCATDTPKEMDNLYGPKSSMYVIPELKDVRCTKDSDCRKNEKETYIKCVAGLGFNYQSYNIPYCIIDKKSEYCSKFNNNEIACRYNYPPGETGTNTCDYNQDTNVCYF